MLDYSTLCLRQPFWLMIDFQLELKIFVVSVPHDGNTAPISWSFEIVEFDLLYILFEHSTIFYRSIFTIKIQQILFKEHQLHQLIRLLHNDDNNNDDETNSSAHKLDPRFLCHSRLLWRQALGCGCWICNENSRFGSEIKIIPSEFIEKFIFI